MSTICGSFDEIISSSENVKTFSEAYLILQPKMGRGIIMRYAEILDFKLRHSVRRGLNPAGILDLIKNP
jgi:hypothetical protein